VPAVGVFAGAHIDQTAVPLCSRNTLPCSYCRKRKGGEKIIIQLAINNYIVFQRGQQTAG
jgi:hypothetical protein